MKSFVFNYYPFKCKLNCNRVEVTFFLFHIFYFYFTNNNVLSISPIFLISFNDNVNMSDILKEKFKKWAQVTTIKIFRITIIRTCMFYFFVLTFNPKQWTLVFYAVEMTKRLICDFMFKLINIYILDLKEYNQMDVNLFRAFICCIFVLRNKIDSQYRKCLSFKVHYFYLVSTLSLTQSVGMKK